MTVPEDVQLREQNAVLCAQLQALRCELEITRAQLAEAQERALRHADALGRLVLEMPSRAIKDAMSAPKHLKREASL